MKKILILFTALFLFKTGLPVYSFNLDLNFNNNREIRSLLKSYDKALRSHDINAIKSFFDESYVSADGFSIEDYISMLEKTYNTYENIKYETKINNITSYDNWALAQMSDKTKAKVYPDKNIKSGAKVGILDGKSSYVIYLKKTNDGWKIVSDDVLMEETSLKYGIANKIDMNLVTPVFIENGKEYDISLKINTPDDIIALASLSREEVVYPPVETDEKYRKFPESGELERLVTANNKNLDEYAIASVGFTRVSVSEELLKARIEVLGMAYIMKRINTKIPPMISISNVEKGSDDKN